MEGSAINNLRFTYGRDLMRPSDLSIWSFKNLVNFITRPSRQFLDLITTLREMLALDPEEYQRFKRHLPYFLLVVFKPPYRKIENVNEIYGFIIDVDKCSRIDVHPEMLKEQLSQDENILLMFTSPSGDGLKVLFYFEAPLTDPYAYQGFYKQFVEQWAARHNLIGAVDTRTHDASRVCFLSYDPNAYWNEKALPVSFEAAHTLPTTKNIPEIITSETNTNSQESESESTKEEVPDEVIRKIKQLLDLSRPRPKRKKHIFVPPEIKSITPCILENLEEVGLTIIAVNYIHYGVQIQFSSETKQGEVNVFFGKRRGYTVVPTSRSTMDHEFSKLTVQLIYQIIDQCQNKTMNKV